VLGEKQAIVTTIIGTKKNWIGYVMRGEGLSRVEVIEARMEWRRPRGRRRMGMLKNYMRRNRIVL